MAYSSKPSSNGGGIRWFLQFKMGLLATGQPWANDWVERKGAQAAAPSGANSPLKGAARVLREGS